MEQKKALGMKWLHCFYVPKPLGLVVCFGTFIMSIAPSNPLLSCFAAIDFILIAAMVVAYWRHRWYGLYPSWLYYVTIYFLWFESFISCFTLNPFFILFSILYSTLNHIYFYHRKYIFFEAEETREIEKTEKESVVPIVKPAVKTPPPVKTDPLIGKKVQHKTYGVGVIRKHVKDYLLIEFETVVKEFMFPKSFNDGWLTLFSPRKEINDTEIAPPPPPPPPETDVSKFPPEQIFEMMRKAIQPLWVRTHPYGDVVAQKKLFVGSRYGTNAQEIFKNCCETFGWNSSRLNDFRRQSTLYSYGAANGKSPWFLCHHSWIEPTSKRLESSWWNIITREYVFEEWRETLPVFFNDWSERITFARTRDGYVFIGTFKPVQIIQKVDPYDGKLKNIKVYRLIEKNYNI